MLSAFFKGVELAHAIVFLLAGAFHVWFWATRGFWVPRYVHVLAGAAAGVGLLVLSGLPEDAPIRAQGVAGYVLAFVLFPALVYGTFVIHGGPKAALEARRRRQRGDRGPS